MERLYNSKLKAVLPVYEEGIGNSTEILVEGQEPFIIHRTTKYIIKKLCDYYHIDRKRINLKYGEEIQCKNLIPIPFDRENIFIPVKTRKPICKGDGAFGYINKRYIVGRPVVKGGIVEIKLGKRSIDCICRLDTVNKHLRNGDLVESRYERPTMYVNKIKRLGYLLAELGIYYE